MLYCCLRVLPRVAPVSRSAFIKKVLVTLEIIVTRLAVASVADKTTHWRYRRVDPTDAVFYFQKRRFKVLVTTDLASSGIHPCDVAHVIIERKKIDYNNRLVS